MKICFVGNIQSIHLQKWVGFFLNKGNKISVATSYDATFKGTDIYNIRRLDNNFFFNIPGTRKFTLRLKPSIRKIWYKYLILKINPDILHIHQLTPSYPLDFALIDFKPTIISVWGADILESYQNSSPEIKQKIIFALRKADLITATSKFLVQKTKELIPEKEVEVIPFGIDLEKFSPKSKKKDSKIITIGFIKHLEPKYGASYLIEAFSEVCKEYTNTNLLILGEGSLENELKNLVKELKIEDRVKFIGFVPNDLVPQYLSQMDIFVMPSIKESESFGVAALEASAMEIPVVASDIGGVPEVVEDGKTGILVEPKNVKKLVEAIKKLIEDENLRKKMGKAGRKFVERNYNWTNNAQQMENLYKELLDEKS